MIAREKANVPSHLSLALLRSRRTIERIVDPGSRLGYGKENCVARLLFERRLGLGFMQDCLTKVNACAFQGGPRQAD
jgi:hypothetical protein